MLLKATTARRRGPLCAVCTHPKRGEIDRLLSRGMSAGGVVARYGSLSLEAVRFHAADHAAGYDAARQAERLRLEAVQDEARAIEAAQLRALYGAYGVRQ